MKTLRGLYLALLAYSIFRFFDVFNWDDINVVCHHPLSGTTLEVFIAFGIYSLLCRFTKKPFEELSFLRDFLAMLYISSGLSLGIILTHGRWVDVIR